MLLLTVICIEMIEMEDKVYNMCKVHNPIQRSIRMGINVPFLFKYYISTQGGWEVWSWAYFQNLRKPANLLLEHSVTGMP